MKKEYRIFINHAASMNISYLDIKDWNGDEKEAQEFMQKAEDTGKVYTLKGFSDEINRGSLTNLSAYFIFITKNY